jgi:hypothetical protein
LYMLQDPDEFHMLQDPHDLAYASRSRWASWSGCSMNSPRWSCFFT